MFKLNPSQKYLIAVSGGSDSIFLLNEIVKSGIKDFVVCTVNYNYRDDSNIDQKIVEDYCFKHNLQLELKIIDPNFYQTIITNFEDWARSERYDFFCEIANKYQIYNLLIAHNKNDLVETFLIQQQRKALVSYYGLKKAGQYKNLTVIRPLLDLTKSTIIKSLKAQEINFAIDSTNNDDKFLRNKIRKNLSEDSLNNYIKEIDQLNDQLNQELQIAYFYTKNNLTADEMKMTESFFNFDLKMIQRIIYEYLKLINQENLLTKRANNTSLEIAKMLKTSKKPFCKITIGDYYFVKDFNKVYIVNQNNFALKTILIKSEADLYLVEEFNNWLDIFNAIKKDEQKYPYIVSNDFNNYKKETSILGKKTNRFLIQHKIPYKNRYYKAVVYNTKEKIILNNIL